MTQPSQTNQQMLVFKLGSEEYAIDIGIVHKITGYEISRTIANFPDFVKGIIKSAENMALIIDLRILFNIQPVKYDDRTLMVILKVHDHLFAIVVDEISDVISINEKDINTNPELSALALVATNAINGVFNYNDRLVVSLAIEKLFDTDLLELAKKIKENNQKHLD